MAPRRNGGSSLSVVVAASHAAAPLVDCLESLEAQVREIPAEVILVDGSRDGAGDFAARRFPWVTYVRSDPSAWIPELWRDGIKRCGGEVVAVTTAHCVPARDWLRQIRAAHASPHAAIGGAITKAVPSRLTDWAIYFCRYSAYMPPFSPGEVAEIPGDNGTYKRQVLDRYGDLITRGFWEPVIHAGMRADGFRLRMDPTIVVQYATSYGIAGFLRQRFHHGRIFARQRPQPLGLSHRLARAVIAPVIPALMAARIGLRVLRARRHRGRLLLSLPLVLLFLSAWALGELIGYLAPDHRQVAG